MSCKTCSSACTCGAVATPVPPRQIGAHALEVLEYLELRRQWSDWAEAKNDQGVVDELLERAVAARRSFRVMSTPALRTVRLKQARGTLGTWHQELRKRCAKTEHSLVTLTQEALAHPEAAKLLEREGVSKKLIQSLAEQMKEWSATVRVSDDALLIEGPDWHRRVQSAGSEKKRTSGKTGDLLPLLAKTWSSRGRGLLGPVFPPGDDSRAKEVGWEDGLGHALVYGEWFFDRDVRDLQDRCGLPEISGSDGGVTAVIGIVVIVVGLILIAIAGCVDDPTAAEVLATIGLILTIAGIVVLAAGGAPIRVCGPVDPHTGTRECTTI